MEQQNFQNTPAVAEQNKVEKSKRVRKSEKEKQAELQKKADSIKKKANEEILKVRNQLKKSISRQTQANLKKYLAEYDFNDEDVVKKIAGILSETETHSVEKFPILNQWLNGFVKYNEPLDEITLTNKLSLALKIMETIENFVKVDKTTPDKLYKFITVQEERGGYFSNAMRSTTPTSLSRSS